MRVRRVVPVVVRRALRQTRRHQVHQVRLGRQWTTEHVRVRPLLRRSVRPTIDRPPVHKRHGRRRARRAQVAAQLAGVHRVVRHRQVPDHRQIVDRGAVADQNPVRQHVHILRPEPVVTALGRLHTHLVHQPVQRFRVQRDFRGRRAVQLRQRMLRAPQLHGVLVRAHRVTVPRHRHVRPHVRFQCAVFVVVPRRVVRLDVRVQRRRRFVLQQGRIVVQIHVPLVLVLHRVVPHPRRQRQGVLREVHGSSDLVAGPVELDSRSRHPIARHLRIALRRGAVVAVGRGVLHAHFRHMPHGAIVVVPRRTVRLAVRLRKTAAAPVCPDVVHRTLDPRHLHPHRRHPVRVPLLDLVLQQRRLVRVPEPQVVAHRRLEVPVRHVPRHVVAEQDQRREVQQHGVFGVAAEHDLHLVRVVRPRIGIERPHPGPVAAVRVRRIAHVHVARPRHQVVGDLAEYTLVHEPHHVRVRPRAPRTRIREPVHDVDVGRVAPDQVALHPCGRLRDHVGAHLKQQRRTGLENVELHLLRVGARVHHDRPRKPRRHRFDCQRVVDDRARAGHQHVAARCQPARIRHAQLAVQRQVVLHNHLVARRAHLEAQRRLVVIQDQPPVDGQCSDSIVARLQRAGAVDPHRPAAAHDPPGALQLVADSDGLRALEHEVVGVGARDIECSNRAVVRHVHVRVVVCHQQRAGSAPARDQAQPAGIGAAHLNRAAGRDLAVPVQPVRTPHGQRVAAALAGHVVQVDVVVVAVILLDRGVPLQHRVKPLSRTVVTPGARRRAGLQDNPIPHDPGRLRQIVVPLGPDSSRFTGFDQDGGPDVVGHRRPAGRLIPEALDRHAVGHVDHHVAVHRAAAFMPLVHAEPAGRRDHIDPAVTRIHPEAAVAVGDVQRIAVQAEPGAVAKVGGVVRHGDGAGGQVGHDLRRSAQPADQVNCVAVVQRQDTTAAVVGHRTQENRRRRVTVHGQVVALHVEARHDPLAVLRVHGDRVAHMRHHVAEPEIAVVVPVQIPLCPQRDAAAIGDADDRAQDIRVAAAVRLLDIAFEHHVRVQVERQVRRDRVVAGPALDHLHPVVQAVEVDRAAVATQFVDVEVRGVDVHRRRARHRELRPGAEIRNVADHERCLARRGEIERRAIRHRADQIEAGIPVRRYGLVAGVQTSQPHAAVVAAPVGKRHITGGRQVQRKVLPFPGVKGQRAARTRDNVAEPDHAVGIPVASPAHVQARAVARSDLHRRTDSVHIHRGADNLVHPDFHRPAAAQDELPVVKAPRPLPAGVDAKVVATIGRRVLDHRVRSDRSTVLDVHKRIDDIHGQVRADRPEDVAVEIFVAGPAEVQRLPAVRARHVDQVVIRGIARAVGHRRVVQQRDRRPDIHVVLPHAEHGVIGQDHVVQIDA